MAILRKDIKGSGLFGMIPKPRAAKEGGKNG
jgi:hypothetical protein